MDGVPHELLPVRLKLHGDLDRERKRSLGVRGGIGLRLLGLFPPDAFGGDPDISVLLVSGANKLSEDMFIDSDLNPSSLSLGDRDLCLDGDCNVVSGSVPGIIKSSEDFDIFIDNPVCSPGGRGDRDLFASGSVPTSLNKSPSTDAD